ncbi:sugar 3,4-ketoisomerase [Harryflintia acetispora]|uniref:sugar 3,4-ketoisomerase n=1 Tax=Harryflintia acetispora TaxID=1849041 RepID=UPI001A9B1625|nr:FdtA/QdtA family cupin domain-containing protein [Harryflintia acetispora]
MNVKKTTFAQRRNDTGMLTFLEARRDIPFDIKRIYYIFDVAQGARRGFHSHKTLEQYLICIHGSCKILLDDGKTQENILLDDPSTGLYVGPDTWREMYDFSSGAVLLVLASEYYSEDDYIRDYNSFLAYLKEKQI